MTICLLDADSLMFRVALTCNDNKHTMRTRLKKAISDTRTSTFCDDILVGIKGPGDNFRYDLYPDYKKKRPALADNVKDSLNYLYRYAEEDLGAVVTQGNIETDDAVALWVKECVMNEDRYVIAHIDKDLDMLPGTHYNFVKHEHYHLSVEDCQRNFFNQLLMGDTIDNIPGAKGIGKVKAKKILDANPPRRWIHNIRRHYPSRKEMELNARLLFMGLPEDFTYDLSELYPRLSSVLEPEVSSEQEETEA